VSGLGPLVPADEQFHHQITNTFATVAQSDRSWTEKVCAMAAPTDGSWQVAFGMGKYPNRNVLDAYAGVSRGREQWTVRASRRLAPAVDRLEVGPIRYEVLEPLSSVRFTLAPNEVVPISFEWTFTGVVPPALELPDHHRSRDGYRADADIVRYHHIGSASGWVDIDGGKSHMHDAGSVSTRDHSWGVRYMVGAPVDDVEPNPMPEGVSTTVLWSPLLCRGPDGDYGIHIFYERHRFGDWHQTKLQGGIEHADGRREPFASLVLRPVVDDDNRRLLSAQVDCTMSDGSQRQISLAAIGETGFHLGTGLYFGLDDHWHGQWRGDLHVEGEHIVDCTEAATARRIHQIRDNLMRVEDPTGRGSGIGNVQTIFAGPHPEIGLTQEASFF
jgi:hypothetical protein